MQRLAASLAVTLLALLAVGGCSSSETNSLDQGLVAYYKFDGNARDSSKDHVDGDLRGATFTDDRFGHQRRAVNFDGRAAQVEVPRERYAAGNQLSVSLWLKTSENAALNQFMFCSDFGVFTKYDSVGLAITLDQMDTASGGIALGAWNHFVGTYDGRTIRAYVNGDLAEAKRFGGSLADLRQPLTFGGLAPRFWAGALDSVRIYDRVLTDDEIHRLFVEK